MDERSPIHADDQRLRTRLQELQAKAWIDHVMTIYKLPTPYQLDKRFGGGQRKWKAYQGGQMPNDLTLQAVDSAFPGTRDWIERGPDGLALWPALGHRDWDVVAAIANQSSRLDGQIAQLRLDAARDLIEVEYPPPPKLDAEGNFIPDLRYPPVWYDESEIEEDDYMVRKHAVIEQLRTINVLPLIFCDEIANYLHELLRPYRMNAYRKKFEAFYDEIMDTRLTYEAAHDSLEESFYEGVRMDSIGNKGRRSDIDS